MKRFKKSLALLLVVIMAVSAWGCKKDDDKTSTDPTAEVTESAAAESEEPAASEEVSTSTEPFYIYSWNTELEDRLQYFKDKYPEYTDRIQYVNIGDSAIYQEKIDGLLGSPDSAEYPDLFALEADYIKKYVNSDYTLDVADLGITADDYANQYAYTLTIPTNQSTGAIQALSWQACPGSMMYRRSLAKTYLGTDEPDKVQEFVSDWDKFFETARTINEKSGGATKILSGNDDIVKVYLATKTKPWVDENSVFSIDDNMLAYFDAYKTLEEEDLTNKTSQWTEQWNANCANDSTFAYFGCTWFLHWTIKANCGGEKVGEGTYGDWAMCQGPAPYYWGGTWLAATANCSDKQLAGLIMKTLTCDTETMNKMADETLDYVNNKEAVQQLIDAGKGPYEFLGGQDFLSVFSPLAENVDVSWMSAYDQKINEQLDIQVKAYANGEKDKDAAIADFKAGVADMYPTLTVE
ncbi:hypothetical protein [Anaeromicropila populeti]|uniref:ABC-type glycerol-3-phosphate transport system, substrate-binding protein n=1 Tax=Anaeromicropila populeti TaxID=37658 RepID=A0A1I6IA16_9FIRM|nr:hypothetical protein [Anaeromicropila populeti]SFR63474.1 ABC-type glycerol-3-phosphate transport system, substrate-binding protein [Anaeromicropila populeti]